MIISPATGRGKLYGSLKDLRLFWEHTQEYWRDPASGNAFQIQVEIPYQRMDSVAALGIAVGKPATAIIKADSIMLGVE